MKDWQEIQQKLQAPFPSDQLEWRIGQCGETRDGKPWAKILCYVTSRAVANRLDEVFGVLGWDVTYREWHTTTTVAAQICTITVRGPDGSVASKEDGAESTDIESVKGGISSAFKRAAVAYGIGRYLYGIGETWAECSTDRKPGFHYAKDKSRTYYWRVPNDALPAWATTGGPITPPSTKKAPESQPEPEPPQTQPSEPPAASRLPEWFQKKGLHPGDTPNIRDWYDQVTDWAAVPNHRRFSGQILKQTGRLTSMPAIPLGQMDHKELAWHFENFHIPAQDATDADWILRAALNKWFMAQQPKEEVDRQ